MPSDRTSPPGDSILVRTTNGARMLTLNRPERRNALTPEVARVLAAQIRGGGSDGAVWAVFLRGAGGHFSVGLDLKWLLERRAGLSHSVLEEGLAAFQDVVRAAVECPVPVIAVVEGSVAGIGLDIALACDIRIASDTASIRSAFAGMGLVPDGGSTFTLPRTVGQGNALGMLLTGEAIDATRAKDMGLVSGVYGANGIDGAVMALAQELRVQSRHSLVRIKELVRNDEREAIERRLELEGKAQLAALTSDEFARRLREFVSRR